MSLWGGCFLYYTLLPHSRCGIDRQLCWSNVPPGCGALKLLCVILQFSPTLPQFCGGVRMHMDGRGKEKLNCERLCENVCGVCQW